jgi:glycosyltransferase involved in cell wall biosynthesis
LFKSILLIHSMGIPRQAVSNKTIAFVSNNAWSVYNFRLDVIRWLLRNGNKVFVLSPHDDYASRLESEGCLFVRVDFSNKSENPFSDIAFYRQLCSLYRQLRPDFIFHYVAKPNIYGSMAAYKNRIPSVAVITGLGYAFARRDLLFYIIRMLYRRGLKNAKEIWFLNNEDANVFVAEKMVDISRTRILPGEGVNTEHFSPVPRNAPLQCFRFVMCTRLLKSKGIGIYADAARLLRNRNHKDVSFSLVGFFEKNHPDSVSSDDLSRWQQEGLIEWTGFADDVRPFLAEAHCLVFPSFYNEGVPRCLLEAGSMEMPAITSMNRGCREVVVDGVNGFLSKINDPFDLADKMEKMMRLSEADRRVMGSNGRKMVLEKFDVAKIIQVYANTLISAFENTHGSHRKNSSTAEDH